MIRQLVFSAISAACVLCAHAGPLVEIKTNLGSIVIELNQELAPKSTANFVQYVKEGFYNGTVFHRVIGNFMIQGGGMDAALNEKQTHAPIKNEAENGLKNEIGTVAMARTSAPNSATSQFFINVAKNSFLDHPTQTGDWGYAVIGRVTKGMDVVQAIAKSPTHTFRGYDDVPVNAIVIESASLVGQTEDAPAHGKATGTTK